MTYKPNKVSFKMNEILIITDPCYVFRDDKPDYDWDNFTQESYNEYIKNVTPAKLVMSTGYGDWDNKIYGFGYDKVPEGQHYIWQDRFCADSGMVAVFTLEDLIKYNPDCIALSRLFDGNGYNRENIDEECFLAAAVKLPADTTVTFEEDDNWSTIVATMTGTKLDVFYSKEPPVYEEDDDEDDCMCEEDY